ncbi:MAG: hypothetical protein V1790_01905, partial [Planctomycetota bacterium]
PICGGKPCAHFIRPTSPHLSVTRPQPHPGDDCFKDYRPDERLFCNIVGGVDAKHLDYYLDEYTFRFNRRSSRARGLLFHRLMEQAATTGPTRYRDLVGGNHNG